MNERKRDRILEALLELTEGKDKGKDERTLYDEIETSDLPNEIKQACEALLDILEKLCDYGAEKNAADAPYTYPTDDGDLIRRYLLAIAGEL